MTVKITDIHEGDTVIVRGSFGSDPPTSAIVTGVEKCIKNGRSGIDCGGEEGSRVMANCPSMDWDRYCRQNDPPEECPICDKPNSDDDGNPVCAEAADFCSIACRDVYLKLQREEDESMARAEAESDTLDAELRRLGILRS